MSTFNIHSESMNSANNPFPGLRSFDVWENYLFFGRDKQTDALLKKLTDQRFVSVVGTSGSGKSSLVRAGLLPVLYGGFMVNAGSSWRVAIFRPGSNPIANMAAALNSPDVFGSDDDVANAEGATITTTTLESSSLGLVQAVRQARMSEGENLLIVVDQFEELFRFKENAAIADAANHAAAFVKLLLEAVHQKELPIYVVLTLRSDFLGDCAQYRDLPEAINEGQFLIPRLRREQHREAIVGPVAVGGGKMAPRLVQQLLNDVGDNPDQLPILQHALMRTWDYWTQHHAEGEPIDIRHYEEIGGMSKALSQHADEAYSELPDDRSRRVCEVLFKCLTERGPDNRGIRRPSLVKEVCAIANAAPEEVIAVVDIFRKPGRSFIMPPHGVPLTAETMLDISHESLMRVWERLVEWVDEDAQSAAMYLRLVESAALHEIGQAGVWRDPELQEALNWRVANQPNAAWGMRHDARWALTMGFLEESARQRDREVSEKRRRRRLANILIAAFLVFAGVLSVWALSERGRATKSAQAAVQQQQIAEEQRTLAQAQSANATQSASIAERQRAVAEKEKAEAEKQKKIADQKSAELLVLKRKAEQSSEEAIAASVVARSEEQKALLQKKIADSLKSLAEQARGSVERLRLLSIAKALAIKSVQLEKSGADDVSGLLALQAFEFNRANGGAALEPDIYDALHSVQHAVGADEGSVLRAHRAAVRAAVYASDGSAVFTGGSDGNIVRWSPRGAGSPSSVVANVKFGVRCVALSPDNSLLAFGGSSPDIRIVNLRDPAATMPVFSGDARQIVSIAFLPGGTQLAAVGADGSATIYDLKTGAGAGTLAMRSRIRSIAVAANGTVACGGEDGSVGLWSAGGYADPATMVKDGRGAVHAMSFSRDGQSLAVGQEDGVVRVWNMAAMNRKPVQLIGHKSSVLGLAFNSTGTQLVSGSADGRARLWNLQRPNDASVVLTEHDGWVWSVAFSPDGAGVVSASADRTARAMSTQPEQIAAAVRSHMTRNFTQKEWEQYVGTDIPYQKTCPQLAAGTE